MDPKHLSVEELVINDKFILWVKNCTPELDDHWKNYMDSHPSQIDKVLEAKSIVESLSGSKILMDPIKKDKLLKKIKSEITATESSNSTLKNNILNRRYILLILSLVFVAFVSFLVYVNIANNLYQTDYNITEKISLPDGSVVSLNANSELRYEDDWNELGLREVWLKGEAFFDIVKSNKALPFVVHVDDVDVKVLGTSFNVNAHDIEIEVVLVEGMVELSNSKSLNTRLTPGDKCSFNTETEQLKKIRVNTEVYTAWLQGKMFFDNTPLSHLKGIIENNYGYDVIVEDESLLLKKLDGQIDSADLDVVLASLESIFNLKIEKNKKEIIIMN